MKKHQGLFYVMFIISFLVLFLELGLRFSGKLQTYSEQNFGLYQSPYATNTSGHIYKEDAFDTINAQQIEFQYQYVLNDFGLNDSRYLDSLNRDSAHIFLGDSFTFGVGAPQDSSLPALLSNLMQQHYINAGFSGSDPFFQQQLIERVFIPQGFKHYVIMLNISDLYDYIFRGGHSRFLANGKVVFNEAPWWEFLHKHSFILRAVMHGVLKMDFTLLPPKLTKQKKQEAAEAYLRLLKEINQTVAGNLTVILQPYARQYASGSSVLNEVMEFSYLKNLGDELHAANINFINLDEALKTQLNAQNYLAYSWKIDGHYNGKGYMLLAKSLVKKLEN